MDRKTTGKKGWPDFTFAVNGRACVIEVKVADNKLTEEQERILAGLYRNGWHVGVVRSLQEVKEFLQKVEE